MVAQRCAFSGIIVEEAMTRLIPGCEVFRAGEVEIDVREMSEMGQAWRVGC